MKYFKTEDKRTGKIEIYDQIAAKMNSNLIILGEVSKEENDNNTTQLRDKKESSEYRRQQKIRDRKQSSVSQEKIKKSVNWIGYGEDEGDCVPHNMVSSILANSK